MPKKSRRDTSKRDTALVVVLVVAAAALITYLATGQSGDEATAQAPAETPSGATTAPGADPLAELARRTPGDPLAVGKPDAPVTMVMYSDYRCPFCAKFSRDTEPVLVDRYVDSGVLRIEWRDFPIFGEQSLDAARAGRAAAEQGRFWEFNSTLYAESPQRGHPDLTSEKLREFARKAGVGDLERFAKDMASTRFDAAIQADLGEGSALGVSSTPTFVINGQPVLGAQPTDTFTAMIDAAAGAR